MNTTVITPFEVETSIRPSGADSEEMSGRSSVRSSTNLTGALPPPELVRPSPKATSMQPFFGSLSPNVPHDEQGHPFTCSFLTTDVQECSGSVSSILNSPSPQFSGISMYHSLSEPASLTFAVETVMG